VTLRNKSHIHEEITNDLPLGMIITIQYCREKRLLASSCPSVCLFVRLSFYPPRISAIPTRRISVKFDIGDFYERSIEELKICLKSKEDTLGEDVNTFCCCR
jgi:hypothetical protein